MLLALLSSIICLINTIYTLSTLIILSDQSKRETDALSIADKIAKYALKLPYSLNDYNYTIHNSVKIHSIPS